MAYEVLEPEAKGYDVLEPATPATRFDEVSRPSETDNLNRAARDFYNTPRQFRYDKPQPHPVAQAFSDLWDLVNTPEMNVTPAGTTVLGHEFKSPEVAAEVERIQTTGTPLEKRALGVREGLDQFLSGFTSPLSIGTLGAAGLLKGGLPLSRTLSAMFTYQTGKALSVDTAKQLGEYYALPPEERDPQVGALLWTSAATAAPLAGALGAHALTGGPLIRPLRRGPLYEGSIDVESTPMEQPRALIPEDIGLGERLTKASEAAKPATRGYEILEPETPQPKGETDASKITSTTGVSEPDVRPRVGEETPLPQQGEIAETRPAQGGPEEVAPAPAVTEGWPKFITSFWQRSKKQQGDEWHPTGTAFRPDRLALAGATEEHAKMIVNAAVARGVPKDFILDRSKYTATDLALRDIRNAGQTGADVAKRAQKLMQERFVGVTRHAGDLSSEHVERVAARVPDDQPELKAIAYLHDIVEDTPTKLEEIRTKFGDRIADAVDAETWRKDEEPYFQYIERLGKNMDAVQSKLHDIADNIEAAKGWGDTPKAVAKVIQWKEAQARLQRILDGKVDLTPTIERHIMPDGTPREAWRQEQIHKLVGLAAPVPPGEQKELIFMGGGASSGKTTVKNWAIQHHDISDHAKFTISADDFKTGEDEVARAGAQGIPEYHGLLNAGVKEAAAFVHKESTFMAKATLARLVEEGKSGFYDATMSNHKEDMALVDAAKAVGYTTTLMGVWVNPDEAVRRAVKREAKTGRHIPERSLREGNRGFRDSFPVYLQHFDRVALFDNHDRIPRLILKKSPEKGIEIFDQKAYDEFVGTDEQQAIKSTAEKPAESGLVRPPTDDAGRVESAGVGGREGGGAEQGPQAGADRLAGIDTAISQIASDLVAGKLTKAGAADALKPVYGGTLAEGKFSGKDMSDVIELAVERVILNYPDIREKMNATPEQAVKFIGELKELLAKMPTQTTRSGETDKLQQFSTPPTLAYAANWVANLRPSDVVLEPSAGVGGLAVFAKAAGATVLANELSPRRAALLAHSGTTDQITQHNAEHIHALLPDAKPTAVVMNPPFSNAAMTDQKNTLVGGKHIESALKMLPPGGRLVAIVGRGMAADKPTFKGWWKMIGAKYNVRANIGVSGKEYTKYGTSFDNQLVVIDNTGPTPAGATITGNVQKIEELIPRLEGIRNDRGRTEPTTIEPGGAPSVAAPQPATGPAVNAPAVTGAPGTGGGRGTSGPALPGRKGAGGLGTKRGNAKVGARPAGKQPARDAGLEITPAASGEPNTRRTQGSIAGITVSQRKAGQNKLAESGVFSEYVPRKIKVPGAMAHPSPLVEPTAMAAVDPVDPTYTPNLPAKLIAEGGISESSIENVIYAGQAHQEFLPNGERMGYFIGDGTGVGKGRQLGGIILDNWNQGRRKSVWVTKSQGLINDAKRDLGDVGFDIQKVIDFGKKPKSLLVAKEGVAFVPYSSLRVGNPGIDPKIPPSQQPKLLPPSDPEKPSRMNVLQGWLGHDFDGVIVFDEAHQAGNAIDIKGKRGIKKSSAQARAVLDVQAIFPKARIVYASATGATDVTNLSYADRLGIWGPGTAWPTKQAFFETIKAGGLSAMEIVARDLKSMGRYLARTLSYEGVTRRQLVHELTPEQNDIYNELARGWQYVLDRRDESMARTGEANNGFARGKANAAFYGAQQRFYNQLLTAMQMPSMITDIKAQLAAGKSAVIQIVNTNEATLGREIAEKGGDAGGMEKQEAPDNYLEDLDLTPKKILLQYIENSFPTALYQAVTDANGNTVWQPVVDAQGRVVPDPEAVKEQENLLLKVGLMKAPQNPLEMLMDVFGVENVAEITGRSQRTVNKLQADGTRKVVLEKNRGEPQRKQEAKEFNDLKRRVLVFSDAGGTGFSYHAGRKFKNQQRRFHYLAQAGWRADTAIQGFGRTNRTDQSSAPEYVLASTNIKGHQRFISTIARRLSELGALTGGERKSAGGEMFDETSNLENEYADDGIYMLFHDLSAGRIPGIDFMDISKRMGYTKKLLDPLTGEIKTVSTLINKETGALDDGKIPTVQQFLNRILSLEVAEQNKLFDAFVERMQNRIAAAKNDGSYDPGTQTLKALEIKKLTDEVVYQHPKSTARTRLVEIEHTQPVTITKWKDIQPRAGEDRATIKYVRNIKSGKLWQLQPAQPRTLESGQIVDTYFKRSTSSYSVVPQSEIHIASPDEPDGNYDLVPAEKAKAAWDEAVANTPKTKNYRENYVVGAFLPIWDRLKIPDPKIWRVTTTAGETFLGAHVPTHMLADLRGRLGAGGGAARSGEDVFRSVLERNQRVELANGWRVFRSRVGGEQRIEVAGLQFNDVKEFETHIGGFMERIAYQPRFFLPTDETGGMEAMEKLIAKSPPIQPKAADPAIVGMGGAIPSEFQRTGTMEQQLAQAIGTMPRQGAASGLGSVPGAASVANVVHTGRNWMRKWYLRNVAASQQVLNLLLGPPPLVGPYWGVKAEWVMAQQVNEADALTMIKAGRKQFPAKLDRQAMGKYAEAMMFDNPRDKLQEWAANSKPAQRTQYEMALQLSQSTEHQNAILEALRYYEKKGEELQAAGLLGQLIEDYAGQHMVDRTPTEEFPPEFNALRADLDSGKLNTNFKYGMRRIFQTEFDLEQAGHTLKTTDLFDKLANYGKTANNTLAARQAVKAWMAGETANGRPLFATGVGRVLKEATDEKPNPALLVNPKVRPNPKVKDAEGNYLDVSGEYVKLSHPAFKKWQWMETDPDTGRNTFVSGDVWAHKSIAPDLKRTLGHSALYNIPGVATVTKVNAAAKGIKLVGLFHQVKTGSHALFHLTLPWGTPEVNVHDEVTQSAMRNGLMLYEPNGAEVFSEGLASSPILHKIPLIGPRLRNYQEYLFQNYIPRIKVATYKNALERNRKRYPTMPDQQIQQITAHQVNSAFGLMNWKLLGTDPTFKHFLGLSLLAPDFQAAQHGFAAQTFTKTGAEQRMAMAIMIAAVYTLARLLNLIFDQNPHWEPKRAFGVVYHGREYGLRTVASDVVRAFTDTSQFIYHRLAPIPSSIVEFLSKQDVLGRKETGAQALGNIALRGVPMPITPRSDLGFVESALTSTLGLYAKRYSAVSDIRQKAGDWMEEHGTAKEKQARKEMQQSSYPESKYLPLRQALQDGDLAKAREAYLELRRAGVSQADIRENFNPSNPLATRNAKQEPHFIMSLKGADRKLYSEALRERRAQYQNLKKVMGNAK